MILDEFLKRRRENKERMSKMSDEELAKELRKDRIFREFMSTNSIYGVSGNKSFDNSVVDDAMIISESAAKEIVEEGPITKIVGRFGNNGVTPKEYRELLFPEGMSAGTEILFSPLQIINRLPVTQYTIHKHKKMSRKTRRILRRAKKKYNINLPVKSITYSYETNKMVKIKAGLLTFVTTPKLTSVLDTIGGDY